MQQAEGSQNESGRLLRFKLYGIETEFQIRYSLESARQQGVKLMETLELNNAIADKGELLIQWLAALIVWWNMEDDNKPLPITIENIKELPFHLVITMANAITDDLNKLQIQ